MLMPEAFLEGLRHAVYAALDTETTGLRVKEEEEDYLIGLSVAFEAGGQMFSKYFPVDHNEKEDNIDEAVLFELNDILKEKTLFFHNRKFDLHSLMTIGLDFSRTPAYDTMLLAQLINEETPYEKSLDNVGKHYIKKGKVSKDAMAAFTKSFGWGNVPASLMAPYACGDAEVTLELGMHLLKKFEEKFGVEANELWRIEWEMQNSLFAMEQRGVGVDLNFCKQYSAIARFEMDMIVSELDFEPSKSTQLSKFLFQELGLPILEPTPTGKPKMDKSAMEEYERMLSRSGDHRAQLVLNYRGWQKANSTFYTPFQTLADVRNKIHCNYKQHGTVTGRLSCAEPNLQQIPRLSDKVWNGRIRQAFRASDGFSLMGYDYSQLEFRLAAAYGNESWLIEEFSRDDADPFTALAARIGTDRYTAKTFTYAMIYGAGLEKITKTLNRKPGDKDVEDAYNNFQGTIPGIINAKNKATARARSRGYIRYWSGRRRHFRNPEDSYKAFNALLQGGASEVLKRVTVEVDETVCDENCRLLLSIHDELVFEIRQGMEEDYSKRIIAVMEHLPTEVFKVRFKVAAKSWGE